MNRISTNPKSTGARSIVDALESTLVPLEPRRELFDRLQAHVRTLGEQPAKSSLALPILKKADVPMVSAAGVFMVLMTVALGFRTAGSIISGLLLAAEMNRQVKSRKSSRLTTTG